MSLLDPDKITLWSPAYIQRYGSDSSKVFTFKKSKGALKFFIIVFFSKTFILLQRLIAKMKILNSALFNIFLGLKNGQDWFYPWRRRKLFFVFPQFVLLNKLRNKFCFRRKILNRINNMLIIFRITGKIC